MLIAAKHQSGELFERKRRVHPGLPALLEANPHSVGMEPTVHQAFPIGAWHGDHRKRIVAALVDWLQANAPKGAYVSLIADGPAKDLYAQYGFEETAPASVGMSMWVR